MEGINRFASDELKACFVYITRDEARGLAKRFRQETSDNYKQDGHRGRIEKYKLAMAEGRWSVFATPENDWADFVYPPLMFTPGGFLYEGKHRIIALSEQEENISVPFLAILGFKREYQLRWAEWIRVKKT